MATLVTRSGKGSPLTHAEVDANFTNLNTDKLELSGGTMTGNLSFGDNDKAIFGAGSDLQIYHDGSYSYIDEVGTNDLVIRGSNNIWIQRADGTETLAKFTTDGACEFRYDNALKLATTSTGVDITGTLTSDGLTVDGDATVNLSSGQSFNVFRSPNYATIKIGEDANNNFELHESGDDFFIRETDTSVTKQRIKLSAGGDISFYEDTGTTAKFFWDASAESLGIGTSSPNYKLETRDGDIATVKLTSAAGGNAVNGMRFRVLNSANTAQSATLGMINAETVNSWGGVLTFSTKPANSTPNEAVTERMRIDSSGNVGIGTSSPSSPLNVVQSADTDLNGLNGIRVDAVGATNNRYLGLGIYDTQGVVLTAGSSDTSSSTIAFRTASSGAEAERMRIDSSGNLLVGKTSTPIATVGSAIFPTGAITNTRDGGVNFIANRLTSDGNLMEFKKDGTTVGSIGSIGGVVSYMVLDPRTGGVGLSGTTGTGGAILPTSNAGAVNDGVVSLGEPAYRFKDAYLSGGVYLGGTGSANKLDDYEEGTWTPNFGGTLTTSGGTLTATYVKVGRNVTINFSVINVSWTGSTTESVISGLPFTASSRSTGALTTRNIDFDTGTLWVTATNSENAAQVFFPQIRDNSSWTTMTITKLSEADYIHFAITYETNS